MSLNIHPTAVVHPDAVIGDGTSIGPFSIIEAGASIGKNGKIGGHVGEKDRNVDNVFPL